MDDLIGKAFGSYKVVERIGEGGMAVVYKGYQASLNRYVAIKMLRGDLARDQQFVTRFHREALAVARLSHPNILHVYDTGVAHGVYYIVMDYAEGGTLKDLIQRGPVGIEQAVSFTTQLADALDYAHRQELIHRDVKPSNVLMTRDGHPLLTDFGIARVLHQTSHLTRTGASIGTPEYMAPEQAHGQRPDGRVDIYALGIVLYEMLTGMVPFRADTPVATLYKHVHETPPPLRQVNSSVPAWLEAATNKALAKRPEDRFQRASAFATALRQGHKLEADSRRPPLPPRTAPARTPPPRERRVPTPAPDPSTPATKIRPAKRKRRRSPACLLLGLIAALALVIFGAAGLLFLSELGDIQDRGGSPGVVTSVITQESITIVVTPPSVEKSTSTLEPTLLPTRASVSSPYPTIAPPQPPAPTSVWDIPSLQASVTDFRFYESGSGQVPFDERQYGHSFAKSETRYINYELHLEYPTREAPATFEVSIVYYGPDDTVFAEFTANHEVEAGWDSSWHVKGWGWKDPGEWPAGPYLVELHAEGNLIATDIFEIYE